MDERIKRLLDQLEGAQTSVEVKLLEAKLRVLQTQQS